MSANHKPGWVIVGNAFLEAPARRLTNIELGNLPGVQAFRSRISDLRDRGWPISEGHYVKPGVYEYRLERGWRPPVGWSRGDRHATPAGATDPAATGDALFGDDVGAAPPGNALTEG